MLDKEIVRAAYRAILGREPESNQAVRSQRRAPSIEALLTAFLESQEFELQQYANRYRNSLRWPGVSVQVDADAATLAAMIERTGAAWTKFGAEEPHWSVLTSPRFKADAIAESEAEFYQTGEDSLAMFESALDRAGLNLDRSHTCFELGCGVGRITAALARRFDRVIGCDISENHLKVARAHMAASGLENVSYFHLDEVGTVQKAPEFDVLLSLIVLQHNPPPIMALLLGLLLGKLRPGGVAYFQVPTYRRDYSFDATEYLRSGAGQMEMHVLPQRAVFEIIEASACSLLEVREDGWTGDLNGVSNSLLVQKR